MDYEKLASDVQSMDNAVKDIVTIATSVDNIVTDFANDENRQSEKGIIDFLNAPIGDKADVVMRKAMAAAMVIAKEKGLIQDVPTNAAELAAVVDEGLTRVKTEYMVGMDLISPEKAVEVLVDGAEARAITVIDMAFDSGAVNEIVTDGIVNLAGAIPYVGHVLRHAAELCKPIISAVVAKVEPSVREAITTGVHYVADTAKSIARTAIDTIKKNAWNMAKRLIPTFA